jgi:dolichol-phosphate mannosyltransferase
VIKTFRLDTQVDNAQREVVLAVPAVYWRAGTSANVTGTWTAARLNAFVEEVLDEIGSAGVRPSLNRLILAGHSHAYAILTPLAQEFVNDAPDTTKGALARLGEVWALDSTYGLGHAQAFKKWADKLPNVQFTVVLSEVGFYRHALRRGTDICVKMDADDQMDPDYLSELIEPLVAGRADYTKGNRFLNTESPGQMPLIRALGNVSLSFLIKAASGQWHIFDPTNGYTAIHRAALAALDLQRLHPRYFFESSMLVMLRRIGAVIEDVPMAARYGDERSSLSVTRALIEFPWLLLGHWLRRIMWQYFITDFNVVSLFLVCGVPLVAGGAIFGLYHWIDSAHRNIVTPTGTVMLAVLPLVLGFQLLLQALVLDVQSRPDRPLQARRNPRDGRPDGRSKP